MRAVCSCGGIRGLKIMGAFRCGVPECVHGEDVVLAVEGRNTRKFDTIPLGNNWGGAFRW